MTRAFVAAVLACGLIDSVAQGVAVAAPQAKDMEAWMRTQPMIFFVAEGAPNACGPGCSEWIAAEGRFDRDAAQRFRDFLGALPRRDLPIFFNSPGGSAGQAVRLGKIVREHRMTSGVGRTLPEGCRSAVPTDDACRRVMQSKVEHKARLVTAGARCLSACVDAFVGGSSRHVARDAQLGIHSLRLLPGATGNLEETRRYLKRNMFDMGIAPDIVDAAAKVSADSIKYLSRDEIARFGIETRTRYETSWMLDRHSSERWLVSAQRWALLKSVTQPKGTERTEGTEGTEYRTSRIRVQCVFASRILLLYERELRASEAGIPSVVRLTIGDREFESKGSEDAGKSIQATYLFSDLEFFRRAMSAPDIVIAESFSSKGDAPGWSSVTKLSTKGLDKVLDEWLQNCAEPSAVDVPGVGDRK
jgi:hypothetical protein